MAIPPFTKQDISVELNVNGNETTAVWVPCGTDPYTGATFGGIDSTTSVPKGIGLLCTAVSLDNIPLGTLYEEDIRGLGKNPKKFVSGAKIDEFKLSILGGDVTTLKIMYGLDPSSASINAFMPLPDTGRPMGHLIVRKWNKTTGIVVSYVYPDLCIKFADLAGAEVDTSAMQEVTFYKPQNGDMYIFKGNKTVSVDFFKLISGSAGTGVPASAPDGVIDDFVIGTGNYNGINGTTSPVPLLVNDSVIGSTSSNLQRYFIGVWLNGVLQTDAQVSYTVVSRTLTFATPPALGSSIIAMYVSDWASVLPSIYGDKLVIESENYPWQNYV